MKRILGIILCLPGLVFALSGKAYLERFNTYQQWQQNLPEEPDEAFLAFVDSDTPLANKLREKWLYQLALKHDWDNYKKHYQPSKDASLQCYALVAEYHLTNNVAALQAAKPLWLTGNSQPPACNLLFDLYRQSGTFDELLIGQRIKLALEKRNISLVRYLLKQFKQPRLKDEQLIAAIAVQPARISQLQPGYLHDEFYLYGLKRLVSINMDRALVLWKNPQTKHMLSLAQQQNFLAHAALYKAMRNHPDTQAWFAKIKPGYANDALLEWQIRYALKQQNWREVTRLITNSADKDNPCWQYWLARALEARGQSDEAKALYTELAKTRHYYGFLASLRLQQKPSFQNEQVAINLAILKPYQPFTDQIKALYHSKQLLQASRLLNDFASELPKEDKIALAYWIAKDLQWHGKSVFLSNNEELNNQLTLRFPLAYNQTVALHAKRYSIPTELIYAIIRQESAFREDVVSSAGARGLMQLMPATARMVARAAKIPYSDQVQLFSSQKNINIGVAYLGSLAKRYKHPVLMAAAYNAGPRQVNYWLKNHPPRQIDIWIETLPWNETRNYLKNIFSFSAVYQYRLNKSSNLGEFLQPLN